MVAQMSNQESKRQKVCGLLNALVSQRKISRIVEVSEKTVYNVKKKLTMRKTITRKTESGRNNKKCIKNLLEPSNQRFKMIQQNPCEK